MNKFSPEIEALMTTIVLLSCRMEAILRLLGDKGISIDAKSVDSETHKLHSIQGSVIRYQIACRIKNPNFDIS